jgi:NTE family protein
MNSSARRSLVAAVQRYFSLPPEEAETVLAELEPVVCRGGEWLFRQGESADCMYLLARGRLQVWMVPAHGRDGGDKLIAEVGPGEMIGEVGLLTGGERSAGLRAVRSSLLLKMSSAAFDRLVQRHPALMRRVAGGIAERLRERTAGGTTVSRKFSTIALMPVDGGPSAQALADRLRELLEPQGSVLVLAESQLGALGAPPLPASAHEELSPALVEWLAAREAEHRFVLYVADPVESAWREVAVRHADLVLLVADAASDAAQRPWEREVFGPQAGATSRRALILNHAGRPEKLSGTAAWLEDREPDFHLHVRSGVPGDLERLARIVAGTSVGLVLSGGAARGFAHLGVYRALLEAGIPVDWIGGSSIGAILGAEMSLSEDPGLVIDRTRAAFVGGKPFGDVTFPIVSFLRGRRMERLIDEYLGGMIEDLPIPFFAISSNLGDGNVRVHERGSLPRALRATASLPGIFPPAVVDRKLTVDGGILDNLPVDVMRDRPVGRVVAVDVTARRNYEVDYDVVPSPWKLLAGRMLPFARRYRVPGTMSMLMMAMSIGTMESSLRAGQRADLLVLPSLGGYGFTDVRPFDRIVEVGYQAARQSLEDGSFKRRQNDNQGQAR